MTQVGCVSRKIRIPRLGKDCLIYLGSLCYFFFKAVLMSQTTFIKRLLVRCLFTAIPGGLYDDCRNNNCPMGSSCIDQVDGFTCQCDTGLSGENCEIGQYNVPRMQLQLLN